MSIEDDFAVAFRKKFENSCWTSVCNNKDCILLPSGYWGDLKSNFNIPNNEKILFLRDTSFWNNRNQGLVITNKAICCIPSNEEDWSIYLRWEEIKKVTYDDKEEELIFWKDDDESEGIPFTNLFFGKNYRTYDGSPTSDTCIFLAESFTELVGTLRNSGQSIENEYYDTFYRLLDNEGVECAKKYVQNKVKEDAHNVFLYFCLAQYYYSEDKWSMLLDSCNEGLRMTEKNTEAELILKTFHSMALQNMGHYKEARIESFSVFCNAGENMLWGRRGEEKLSDIAASVFLEIDPLYSEHILELDYIERKVIMPVSQNLYDNLDKMGTFSQICINLKNPIKFPAGHPIENQLYVGHPLVPEKYMPFETYQLELVEDRVREFCMLAQSLGATEISVECLNTSHSDRYSSGKTSFSAQGGNRIISGSGSYESQYGNRVLEELSKSISLRQTYEPYKEPFVPDGLVWYKGEPSWQRLVTQRINGGLKSHEERIETKKSQIIDNDELSKLKAEVKSFWVDAGMEFTNEESRKFVQQENAVLSIKVQFASLREIQENRRNR